MNYFVCPKTLNHLIYYNNHLCTPDKSICYPIVNGIPRFVEHDNYAKDFGDEWVKFGRIQFDYFTGDSLSHTRFFKTTGFDLVDIEDKVVLDAGCGAGRHTEPALELKPKEIHCVDLSHAIDEHKINFNNIANNDRIIRSQASISELPYKNNFFDVIYCMGVIPTSPHIQ